MRSRHPLGLVTKVVGLLTCLLLFGAAAGGLFAFGVLAALLAIPVFILWRLDRPVIPRGHCADCGYDLTGNTSGRCPECGAAVQAEAAGSGDRR